MKTQPKEYNRGQRLPAQFGPEVEFELTPVPGIVSSDTVRIRFQQLQSRLMEDTLSETQNPFLRDRLRQAANEAAALSWTTPYPLLVMPVLFQEKARAVRLRLEKQNQIRMRSEPLVEAVNDLARNPAV